MVEDYYRLMVLGCVVAEKVSLEYAPIFAKAILQEFQLDPDVAVTIERMNMMEGQNNADS